MEKIVTLYTEDQAFPPHSHHHALPEFCALQDIGQLSHMMDFEVPLYLTFRTP